MTQITSDDSRGSSVIVRRFTILMGLLTLWGLTYPFNFQHLPGAVWLRPEKLGKINTLVNLGLFIPFGLLAGWGARLRGACGWLRGIVMIGLAGLVISLLGETLQYWLPLRDSSLMDLMANGFGAAVGGMVGWWLAPNLTEHLAALRRWMDRLPEARWAAAALLVVLVARAAPFDISPETFYLRTALHETRAAGLPFAQTRDAMSHGWADPALRAAAVRELSRAAMSFVLFMAATLALGRAVAAVVRELGGRRASLHYILVAGCGLVFLTELLQGPIRSRLMDATDLCGGLAGVLIACGLSPLMNRHRDQPHARHGSGVSSGLLLTAACLITLLLAYISLVPFRPESVPFREACRQFIAKMTDLNLRRLGRADWSTNGVAFALLGFVWMAWGSRVMRGTPARVVWGVVVWCAATGLGAGLEFAQVFFPERVSNPYDVMAQAAGVAAGVFVFWIAGNRLLRPMDQIAAGHGREQALPALKLYLAAYLVYAVMPLDLVLSMSELSWKYRAGYIRLDPTFNLWPITFDIGWKMFRDVVLAVPVGLLLGYLGRGSGAAVYAKRLAVGAAVFVAIEALHAVLGSRVASSLDVIVASFGVSLGLAMAGYGLTGVQRWPRARYLRAGLGYAAALVVIECAPWDVSLARLNGAVVADYLHTVPFAKLQFGTSFPALDDMMYFVLLGVPLGLFVGAWLKRSGAAWVAGLPGTFAGTGVVFTGLLLLGALQATSYKRYADPTDAVLLTSGALLGVWMAGRWLLHAPDDRVAEPLEDHTASPTCASES